MLKNGKNIQIRDTMKEFLDIIFVNNKSLMIGRSTGTINEYNIKQVLSNDKTDKLYSPIVDEIYARGVNSKNIECEDLGDYFLFKIPVYEDIKDAWASLNKPTKPTKPTKPAKSIYGTLTKTNPRTLELFSDSNGINKFTV